MRKKKSEKGIYNMAKEKLSMTELVNSHKPKNFKFKYIITKPEVNEALLSENYDLTQLDTIGDDDLIEEALRADFTIHDRTAVAKAKEPTVLNDGIILSKSMVTKADKKLLGVGCGEFHKNGIHYVAIKLMYELFDIMELFILV